MLRSILLGLDGSADNRGAVELGIRWARQFDAMLVGLAVIDEPTIRQSGPVPLGGGVYKDKRDNALVADARRNAEQLLGGFSVRCAEAGVSCKVLEDVGLPAERICLEAQRYDLILLGKQTHFHAETQEDADETLTTVLQTSPRPVVAVPEKLGTGTSIMIAYDGSLQAARTLQAFAALQLGRENEVHVVAVDSDHAEAVRRADRAIDFLDRHGVKAKRHAVAASDPAPVLLEHAKRLDAGLLVMGAYGQTAIREFFFGSVTQTMLKETNCPLFLYH
jgi:nucleotide-binding universal stress UspA family protein